MEIENWKITYTIQAGFEDIFVVYPEYFNELKKHTYTKEEVKLLSKKMLETGKSINIEFLIDRGLVHAEDPFYFLFKFYENIVESNNGIMYIKDKKMLDLMFIISKEDMPLYMGEDNIIIKAVIQWRLDIV